MRIKMPWDDDLTNEQKTAASHLGSHARLLAGPGTGKTLTLTRRVLYLLEEKKVKPQEILVLTFTRAACAELKTRLKKALHKGGSLPNISTLHSFALKLILQNQPRNILPLPIRIADDYEEKWIIKKDIRDILKLSNINEIAELFEKLSADWEKLEANPGSRIPNPKFMGAWEEHRKVYGYTLRDELVYQLKQLIIEGKLNKRALPKYILVDEYQDLNPCDLAVIKALADHDAELFCSGDDDQSIYGFRYANPEGIRRFEQEYTPCQSFELHQCKRCSKNVLHLAEYIADLDPRRIKKQIDADTNAQEGSVNILRFKDQNEEAKGIAYLCKWLVNTRKVEPEGILILLRSDHHKQFSKPIKEALNNEQLKSAIVTNPLEVFNCPKDEKDREQCEGRYFISLLRLIANQNDHLAWRTLLTLRNNGIGEKTIEKIYEYAISSGKQFSDVLCELKNNSVATLKFSSRVAKEISEIEQTLNDMQNTQRNSSLVDYIKSLVDKCVQSVETKSTLIGLFENIIKTAEAANVPDLLNALNVSLGNYEQETIKGSINLMTMHQAKGLTSEAVIIVAAEDEYIPGRSTGEREQDERRLLYVSVSRARNYLFITHCNQRIGPQKHTGRTSGQLSRSLSRFLRGGPVQSVNGRRFVESLRENLKPK
jgi:DNA helicase-2/ATP-dependent DNA helicase PcrA